eukprot:NODE_1660_length_2408_cov_3.217887.p1 GENE.NODE_1660_length_2408_cov_3.217887~~NODE_1660_length_2408_cov_3.217887.p1  ORF type:complete len:668 (+),score=178.58 NODE_1660_length_2408_cov_3.217887:50-2005(+)
MGNQMPSADSLASSIMDNKKSELAAVEARHAATRRAAAAAAVNERSRGGGRPLPEQPERSTAPESANEQPQRTHATLSPPQLPTAAPSVANATWAAGTMTAGSTAVSSMPVLAAPASGAVPASWPCAAQRGITEVETDLLKRTVQIQAVTQQIEAAQAEIDQLQPEGTLSREAAAQLEQVRQLAAGVLPEIDSMRDQLRKALKVTQKLNAWFVDKAAQLNIEDPSATPSAFLERILESLEVRPDTMAAGVKRSLEAADAFAAAVSTGAGSAVAGGGGSGAAPLPSVSTPTAAAAAPRRTATARAFAVEAVVAEIVPATEPLLRATLQLDQQVPPSAPCVMMPPNSAVTAELQPHSASATGAWAAAQWTAQQGVQGTAVEEQTPMSPARQAAVAAQLPMPEPLQGMWSGAMVPPHPQSVMSASGGGVYMLGPAGYTGAASGMPAAGGPMETAPLIGGCASVAQPTTSLTMGGQEQLHQLSPPRAGLLGPQAVALEQQQQQLSPQITSLGSQPVAVEQVQVLDFVSQVPAPVPQRAPPQSGPMAPLLMQDPLQMQQQAAVARTGSGTQLVVWPAGAQQQLSLSAPQATAVSTPLMPGSGVAGGLPGAPPPLPLWPQPWVPTPVPGHCPGPTPAAATPGGAGVYGMWVRDPDVG